VAQLVYGYLSMFRGCASNIARHPWWQVLAPRQTAVAGLSARFPGAEGSGAAGFWGAMRSQANLPVAVPLARWDIDRYYALDVGTTAAMYVRMAAFVAGIEDFDGSAFR
jgi:acyl transferase domain-containing protein